MNLETQLDTIERSGYRGSKATVLMKLARLSNGKQGVIASLQTIADGCNITTRAVQYVITTLKADGVLNVVQKVGIGLENLYELRYEALTERSKQKK